MAPATHMVTSSCRAKTSSRVPSNRSAQMWLPVSASISWPVIRSRPPAFRMLPSSTYLTQLAPYLPYVHRPSLVREGRVSCDDEEPFGAAQRSDDVLDETIAEIVLLRVAAHVCERQHRDGWLVRQRRQLRYAHRAPRKRYGGSHCICP